MTGVQTCALPIYEFGQVGPQNFLMDTYGLRAANIVEAVKKAIARK